MTEQDHQAHAPAPAREAGGEAMHAARVVRGAESRVQPLYPATRLVKGAVLEAQEMHTEAQRVMDHARTLAEGIRDQAATEVQLALEQARQKGAAEGAAEFAALIRAAEAGVEQLSQTFAEQVTRVAFRLAEGVLHAEFKQHPERLVDLVKGAVRHVKDRMPQRVLVHLHPDDFDLIEEHREAFDGLLADDVSFGFVKNDNLAEHDVQIETELGHYDFSVSSQLEQIRERLISGK